MISHQAADARIGIHKLVDALQNLERIQVAVDQVADKNEPQPAAATEFITGANLIKQIIEHVQSPIDATNCKYSKDFGHRRVGSGRRG